MRERTHLNHVVSVLYPSLPAIGPQQIEVYNRALANQGRNPSALRLVEELIPDVQDLGLKTRRWPGSIPGPVFPTGRTTLHLANQESMHLPVRLSGPWR